MVEIDPNLLAGQFFAELQDGGYSANPEEILTFGESWFPLSDEKEGQTIEFISAVKRAFGAGFRTEIRCQVSQQDRLCKDFIEANAIEVLNVAGSRESKEPGIYQFTLKLLRRYWQNRAEPIDRLEHPQE